MISNCVKSVTSAFEKDVLRKKFGITACSREDMICKHTSDVVRKLYGVHDQLVLIYDGTYLYHQKSKNSEYQRKGYSGQKKTPPVQTFTIALTDGHVLDVTGLYLSLIHI